MNYLDAMKQALDALCYFGYDERQKAIVALRDAIAEIEKAEPVAKIEGSGGIANVPLLRWLSADHSFREPIGSFLYAHPPLSDEPVAYETNGMLTFEKPLPATYEQERLWESIPLYTKKEFAPQGNFEREQSDQLLASRMDDAPAGAAPLQSKAQEMVKKLRNYYDSEEGTRLVFDAADLIERLVQRIAELEKEK